MTISWFLCALGGAVLLTTSGCATSGGRAASPYASRPEVWVDALRGEPLEFEQLLDELQLARVIYLGELHTIPRHHESQKRILEGLARRGVPLALAMEQFEFTAQPALDRFNNRQLRVNQLVQETDWGKRWRGYTNYLELIRVADQYRVPVLALNARAETIRAVGHNGLAKITPEQRAELPAEIVTDDPLYEKLATRALAVHMAFDPQKLRPIFEAQVARDETMASRLSDFLASPDNSNRTVVVICGRGHCEFGFGVPDRVKRRHLGILQRTVLFSESGDLELSPEERKQARQVEMPHQFLQELGRPEADFLEVVKKRQPEAQQLRGR